MAVQESDEWIEQLSDGRKVKYRYQLLTIGFSASAQILDSVDAVMVYTHTHTNVRPPADRAQIEAEFVEELTDSAGPKKRAFGT
jgi:hypothetical protein